MYDPLSPAHCVSNNLHKTARAVSRVFSEEMRPSGLKRSQFSILVQLDAIGPTRLTALAERLGLDRTTLTRNLHPLEREGLVEVLKADGDARARTVSITITGRQRTAEALTLWRRAQQRLIDAYGAENWQRLEGALRALRQLDP